MKNKASGLVLFLLLVCMLSGAVKTRYGGEIRLRLNEPDTLRMSPSSHSNLLFYSLLYENFFYTVAGRGVKSNLFKRFHYDASTQTLILELHDGLAFSNGKPVLSRHVKNSLTSFFTRVMYRSKKLAGRVKHMTCSAELTLEIQLVSAGPEITAELTAPELVLIGDDEATFSGPYFPKNWDKGRKIELSANPYYAGGRPPIDRATVFFFDDDQLDVFLAESGFSSPSFISYSSGLYENTYITFPAAGNSGQNKRLAYYSLCRNLSGLGSFSPLEALTSADESPVSISIKPLPDRKIVSLLRNAKQIVYLASSLSVMQAPLAERFKQLSIPLEIRTISDNEVQGYIQKNPVPVLILKKLFRKDMPVTEKLASLIRELSFNRFDTVSLRLMKQLEEISGFEKEEVVIPAMAGIIEKLVEDGVILPLYQQRYQLMIRRAFSPVVIDQFGRVFWSELRYEENTTNK